MIAEIDLQPFCSKDRNRPELHQPFSVGEYTYASNGHIVVRIARSADAPEPTRSAQLLADIFKARKGTRLAPLPITVPSKGYKRQASIDVHGVPFDLVYIRLMVSHPELTIAKPRLGPMMHFRFAGGDGALMGLRPPYEHHLAMAA